MSNYITVFETESQYEEFKSSSEFVKPNFNMTTEGKIFTYIPRKSNNSIIRYQASSQVSFKTDAFNANVSSHPFSDGNGMIVFDGDITTIGANAFSGCANMTNISIPSTVTTIGEHAFYGCTSLTSINTPNTVTSIGSGAFQGCSSMEQATLSSQITRIESYTFYGCSSLKNVNIPSNVTYIGEHAFDGCGSLEKVELNDGITSIGNAAFKGCGSLTSLEIPSSVTTIGADTFNGCNGLTSIELHSGITSIGNNAFSGCSNAEKVVVKSTTPPQIGSGVFGDENYPIYVPTESYDLYVSSWPQYADRLRKYVTVPTAKSGLIYNGTAQALVNAGSTYVGTMVYSTDGTRWSTEVPKASNASAYTVYYKVEAENVSGNVACSIAKVTPTVNAPTAKSGLIYNGLPQALANNGSTNWGSLQYSTDNTNWSTSVSVATNASNYTVYYKVVGDSNINDIPTNNFSVSIAKVTPTVDAPTAKSGLIYNATPQVLADGGSTNWGTMQYSLDNSTWDTSVPSVTNASDYTVYYKVVGDSNINDVAAQNIAVSIAKVTPTVTAPTPKTLVYNSTAQALVNGGSTDWGTLQYSLNGTTYATDIPSGTNASEYTVYYRVAGDSNINDVGAQSLAVTISKANPSYTAPTAASLTYNGTAQALLNAGSTSDGTFYYSLDETTWSTSIPTKTSADTYVSYWKLVGDSNHNGVDSHRISTTINKATGSVTTAPTATNPTYNSYAQSLVNAGSGTGAMMYKLDSGSWAETIPTATNASSSYTVYYKAAESDNYMESPVGSITCTIAKVTPTVVAPVPNVLTYNTSAQVLATAGSTNWGTIQYKLDSGSWGASVPSATNANVTYTVYYKVVGDSNINDVLEQSIACTIAEKRVTTPTITLSPSSYTYSGSECKPTPTVKDGSTVIPSSEYTTTYSNNVNAGTASVIISDNTLGNYYISGTTTFAIAKASGSVTTAPTPITGLVYDGSAKTLINAGSGTGTMQYKLDNGSWSTSLPTATNASTSYTVYYKASESTNYTESSVGSITCTIARANRTITWAAKPDAYQGGTSTASATTTGDGSIAYSSSNSNVATINSSTGVITYVASGTCTITASVAQTTNYNSASTSYTLTSRAYPQQYLTFEAIDSGTFKFSGNAVSYSVDNGNTWTELPSDTDSPTVSAGNKIMFKATLSTSSIYDVRTFLSTRRFNAMGNPMSLLYGDDFVGQTNLSGKSYAFKNLFSGCTGLTSAENLSLPATTLANYCYNQMFYGCTSLTTAPQLPATTLAQSCYSSMFQGCTSLTTAPSLPATTLADTCYHSMFYGCTSLTTAPTLSATTLATYCCRNMFSNCTSLTTAPSLPATTLVDHCYYYMFSGCTSLTTAPSLPATTLATYCYQYMFNGCTSLTTAPSLPATTLATYCYSYMFNGCTSLTTAPSLPATTLASYCYRNMFSNCTSLTTAPTLSATTLASYCYCYMFSNCTSLTTAPSLPATTLSNYCYCNMFEGCTSLTTAPSLPATTLANYCYYYMFNGCTNLNKITCLATDISASYCTTNWVNGVAASGTFLKNGSMSSWTTGSSGIPNGWTVVDPPTLVDMGLPSGTKWADRNVGASSPEDYGQYFSWGNVNGQKPNGTTFANTWGTSVDGEPYVSSAGHALTGDIPLSQDAANVNLGGNWLMPTRTQFAELFNSNYTTNEWTTRNGVAGRLVTSKSNQNTLFFPAAGFGYGTSLSSAGSYGGYWSRSFYSSAYGYSLRFTSSYVYPQGDLNRYYGFSVRAVQESGGNPGQGPGGSGMDD